MHIIHVPTLDLNFSLPMSSNSHGKLFHTHGTDKQKSRGNCHSAECILAQAIMEWTARRIQVFVSTGECHQCTHKIHLYIKDFLWQTTNTNVAAEYIQCQEPVFSSSQPSLCWSDRQRWPQTPRTCSIYLWQMHRNNTRSGYNQAVQVTDIHQNLNYNHKVYARPPATSHQADMLSFPSNSEFSV